MSYVGSTPTTQSFISGTDQFTGNGSSTNWTLSRFVNSTNDIQVTIANVVQNPTSYSVSGNTLTISPAVSNGTAIYVRYLSTTLQTYAPSQGTVQPSSMSTGAPYWDVSGNVGIGTSSPVTALQVGSTSRTSDATVYAATGNGAYKSGFVYEVSGQNAGFIGFNKTGSPYLGIPDSTAGFSTTSSIPLVFATLGTERARIDSSGNLAMTGGGQIRGSAANTPPLLADSSGNTATCRAWAQFSGLASPTIQGSFNVSSITRTATGQFRLNFTVAMPDANYSPCVGNGGYGYTVITVAIATTSVTFGTYYPAGGYADGNTLIGMAVFR